MPEISVVMSVYNLANESVLKQSIGSVLKQDFKDIELLICDDGSTDRTFDLLKKFAKADSRIRLFRNKTNRKAGYARNRCIKAAKGNYIAVMDADDISAKNRLSMQHSFLKNHPEYAFAGSRGEFFVSKIGDDGEQYWHMAHPAPKDFLFSLPFVHASILFRKEAKTENLLAQDAPYASTARRHLRFLKEKTRKQPSAQSPGFRIRISNICWSELVNWKKPIKDTSRNWASVTG